jgi:ATP-dependent DNA helicase RecQ
MAQIAEITDRPALRAEAEAVLRRLAGEAARLREDQWTAIEALVADRRRCLVVQRTGWGKSAVYFVATALLRERGAGPTVIVSPLLALMRNQVEAARRAGIRARTINSANLHEWQEIEAQIAEGSVDVLLISPERLNNPSFRDEVLPRLAASVGLLVVDEAHSISDWGHDFRPDYRRLRELIGSLAPGLPVLATTATANARVTADVAEQLGTGGDSALVLRGTLDRASLYLSVLSLKDSASRLAWLAERLNELPGSGIIYTLTVSAAAETADFLRSRGYAVAAYTGRTEDEDRRQGEQDLLDNKIKALVATSALGMGFDKPDLGFVVHLGAPSSPIAYYQQVGRAGRGVERAEVVLLPGAEDREIWRYFTSLAFPPKATVERVLGALAETPKPLSTMALEPLVDLKRSRLELLLKVLDADGAVKRVQGGWISTGQPWFYDEERYARITAAREAEQRAMLEYARITSCRMEFLRRQLDDAEAVPCGRCDNCTGRTMDADVAESVVEAAGSHAKRAWVPIEPRRQWPTGMQAVGVALKGKIPAAELAAEGRALARLTDLGWGSALREILATGAPDRPITPQLLGAMINVLKEWALEAPDRPAASVGPGAGSTASSGTGSTTGPSGSATASDAGAVGGPGSGPAPGSAWSGVGRPVGIVSIASRTRPRLITSTAEGIAEIGKLPIAGSIDRVTDEGHAGPSNSAWRLRAVHEAFDLGEELRARLAECPGPVLLIDDFVDSGWTMTVAARLLRQAGAPAVLPLTLALAG